MNNKTKAIIASGIVLAAAIPAIAFIRRAPVKNLPVPEPANISVVPMVYETTPGIEEFSTPVQIPDAEPVKMQLEDLVEAPETEKPEETKKTSKKTTKKTKKTTKKKNKKNNKKSNKDNSSPKFTYGHSEYTAKNFKVYVTISKDNTADIRIVHDRSTQGTECNDSFSFTGKINPKTGFLTYNNCAKMYHVKTIHVNQTRAQYLHGNGYVTINGNSLTWFDGVEGYANSVTFYKK